MTLTPENVEAVNASFLTSPNCSAKRHASALHLSDSKVRRILHKDHKFHPYKMNQDGGRTVPVNFDRCVRMSRNFFQPRRCSHRTLQGRFR